MTYPALAPVVEDIAPTPAETFAEQAPVDEYIAPAPAVSNAVAAPAIEYVATPSQRLLQSSSTLRNLPSRCKDANFSATTGSFSATASPASSGSGVATTVVRCASCVLTKTRVGGRLASGVVHPLFEHSGYITVSTSNRRFCLLTKLASKFPEPRPSRPFRQWRPQDALRVLARHVPVHPGMICDVDGVREAPCFRPTPLTSLDSAIIPKKNLLVNSRISCSCRSACGSHSTPRLFTYRCKPSRVGIATSRAGVSVALCNKSVRETLQSDRPIREAICQRLCCSMSSSWLRWSPCLVMNSSRILSLKKMLTPNVDRQRHPLRSRPLL